VALGGPDAPARLANHVTDAKQDSVEFGAPEGFLASVKQLKQLVQQ
jgi:hypothetical protein